MTQPHRSFVAITGAGGFVGTYGVPHLAARGHDLRLLVRAVTPSMGAADVVAVGDLSAPAADLVDALRGASAVVHLAGVAHRMVGEQADALAAYRRNNRDASLDLARAAAAAGIRHFLFLSTAYVHGTEHAQPVGPETTLAPRGAYAISKAEAEAGLAAIARETGLAVTIVRPAIVYGPAAKANIRALSQAVARGLPLPFASIRNRRSFLAVENLLSFIDQRLRQPPAAGTHEAFVLADAEVVSTPGFIRLLAAAHGRPARLLPFPPRLLGGALAALGRAGMAQSLIGSFEVDIAAARAAGWVPAVTLPQGLTAMVKADAGQAA